MKGNLIVFEGTDGSGKGTQFRKALERLKKEGCEVMATDFPQYGKPSAYFVEQYLNGKYGAAKEVSPRVASIFYALDRYDKALEMQAWLDDGKLILSNRYTTSNLGHQAGKAANNEERESIVLRIEDFEYGELGIPRPDKVLLLWMHPFVAQQLVASKGKRAYLKGKTHDIHEADVHHLAQAAESYRWVAEHDDTWTIINCMKDDLDEKTLLNPAISPLEKIKTIDEIHELVWVEIKELF